MPEIPHKEGKTMTDLSIDVASRFSNDGPSVTFTPGEDTVTDATAEATEKFGADPEITATGEWEGVTFTPFTTIKDVFRLAEIAKVQESPAAFLAWVRETGAIENGVHDSLEPRFQAAYRGEFDTIEDYGKDWAEDHGIDEAIFPYVGWEAFSRWLAGDYRVCELSTGKIAILSIQD
jgi:antirestriction protein